MDAFSRFIIRFPRLNILAVCLVTVLFGYQIIHIRMETALESFHIRGDKDISFAADFEGVFGASDVIVIGMEGLQMTSLPALMRIERITKRLEELPFVEEVVSLTNVLDVSPIQDGVKIEPLYRMLSERQGTEGDLRNLIKRNPFCLRNLVSEDGRASSINIFLHENPMIHHDRRQIIKTIQEILSQ